MLNAGCAPPPLPARLCRTRYSTLRLLLGRNMRPPAWAEICILAEKQFFPEKFDVAVKILGHIPLRYAPRQIHDGA